MGRNFGITILLLAFGCNFIQTSGLIFPGLVDTLAGATLGNQASCFQQFQDAEQQSHPDINLPIEQVITKYGYPVISYNVTTEDGYILGVFRIPYSPKSPLVPGQTKKAMYLNHGLGGNGQQWILQYGDRNLGFMLADAGFDVFLSNCRGTSHSLGHVNLTQSKAEYWDFSWNEMGIYDVPAVINLITRVTGNQKMYYAGHSMGTTQFFIAMSEHPELNDRIHTGFMLAPIAFIPRATNVVRLLAPLGYNGQYLTDPILGGKIDGPEQLKSYTNLTLGQLCSPSAVACAACGNLIFLLFGYDGPQANYTNMPLELSALPDNIATKSMVHYAQSMASAKFRKFDYGTPRANAARYNGLTSPPEYDLSKITAPTVFIYSANDNLGVPADVQLTASKLNSNTLKENILVDWPMFNHMDFAWAIDADLLVYNHIKATMLAKTYETQ